MKYSDYVVPSIDTHVLDEDKGELAKITMPDPYKTARLPGFLEQCEALVKAKPPTAIGAPPICVLFFCRESTTSLVSKLCSKKAYAWENLKAPLTKNSPS